MGTDRTDKRVTIVCRCTGGRATQAVREVFYRRRCAFNRCLQCGKRWPTIFRGSSR